MKFNYVLRILRITANCVAWCKQLFIIPHLVQHNQIKLDPPPPQYCLRKCCRYHLFDMQVPSCSREAARHTWEKNWKWNVFVWVAIIPQPDGWHFVCLTQLCSCNKKVLRLTWARRVERLESTGKMQLMLSKHVLSTFALCFSKKGPANHVTRFPYILKLFKNSLKTFYIYGIQENVWLWLGNDSK